VLLSLTTLELVIEMLSLTVLGLPYTRLFALFVIGHNPEKKPVNLQYQHISIPSLHGDAENPTQFYCEVSDFIYSNSTFIINMNIHKYYTIKYKF
jgi:hypothetical protein